MVFREVAPQADIDRARELRAEGWSYGAIGRKVGRSRTFAFNHTQDVKKPLVKTKSQTIYKNFPSFPKDPVLAARIRNLAKRGFDVPPSKLVDWETLGKAGIPVDERRRTLALE